MDCIDCQTYASWIRQRFRFVSLSIRSSNNKTRKEKKVGKRPPRRGQAKTSKRLEGWQIRHSVRLLFTAPRRSDWRYRSSKEGKAWLGVRRTRNQVWVGTAHQEVGSSLFLLLSRAHWGKLCLYRLDRVLFVITTRQTARKNQNNLQQFGAWAPARHQIAQTPWRRTLFVGRTMR